MKVICRCNENVRTLTEGKIYQFMGNKEDWEDAIATALIQVIDDEGEKMYTGKWRFDLVEYVETVEEALKGKEAEEELLNDLFKWEEPDAVNHPSHYNFGQFEVIDVIEDWNLNFSLGNAVKYIARAGKKDDMLQDLEKAAWYLAREIERIKKL